MNEEMKRRRDLPPGLAEFIPGYLASRKDELKEMIRLRAASDFESLAILGHNIKGTGTSFGFPEISRIGAALQDSAEQMDTVATGRQLAELGDFLDSA
jgi:histidine phosphotransfer protein HptB